VSHPAKKGRWWMMVIVVSPKALKPAAILFHCHRRPAVCLFLFSIVQSVQQFTGLSHFHMEFRWKLRYHVMSQAHVQRKKICKDEGGKKWRILWGRSKFLRVWRISYLSIYLQREETQRWLNVTHWRVKAQKKTSTHTCFDWTLAAPRS